VRNYKKVYPNFGTLKAYMKNFSKKIKNLPFFPMWERREILWKE